MTELSSYFRESLLARINALEASRKALRSRQPEAIDSIRRISHTLRGSGIMYGFPKISEAATAVQDADDAQVPAMLETLLAAMREVTEKGVSEQASILIIEDNPDILHLLKLKLAAPHREIFVADTVDEAERLLTEQPISLILLDLVLPDMDGRNLLIRLRERSRTAAVPIFVLSAHTGNQAKTECFALGADEFFEKPFDADTIAAAVATKLRRTAEVSRESRQDLLTGLQNRAAFREAFERASAMARRSREPLAIAILDLDHFKMVNDTHGHGMGDEVLARCASVIAKSLRRSDIVARWGGEEFVVLLPDTDSDGAARALEKALETLRVEEFHTPEGTVLHITFSAGAAAVKEGTTVEDAVAEADRYLYLAKAAGRNRVHTSAERVLPPTKHILVATGDDAVANAVRQHLTDEGFDVLHCSSATDTLTAAGSHLVALFLVDVVMPDVSGFDLLKRVRATPQYGDVPVVMLTRVGREDDIVQSFDRGAEDYIVKPFSPVELVARVRRLMKRR